MSVATQREAGTVWVAVLIDRNGHRVMVARSEAELLAKVAGRCRERWHKVSDNAPNWGTIHEDGTTWRHERIVDEYYATVNGEWLEMGEHRL